jgi:membrane protein DedA with SNARE-associated domain
VKPIPLVFAAALVGWLVYRRKRMGWTERVFLILVAVVAVLYGTGVIHPPSLEKIIEDVGTTLGPWTYLLVGALAFLETGAGIGLIAPGEATILLGGFVAGQGKISLVALLAIVWFAAVAGDVTSYFLGRRLGREFLEKHGPRVKISHATLDRVEAFFQRWGGFAILLGRFVGLIRAVAPFVAGASKLPFRRFIPYDVVGAGIWGCGLVILGYVFWQSFDRLLQVAKQGALALGLVIALVVGIVVAYRWLRDPEHRRVAREWLDRQAERPVIRPVVVALRPVVATVIRLVPGRFGLEVSTVLAVGLVGGFAFGALAHAVDSGGPLLVDQRAMTMAEDIRFGALVDASKVASFFGSAIVIEVMLLVVAGLLASRGQWPDAVALIAGGLLVIVAANVAKDVIDRPRPTGGLTGFTGSAYPSGHAAHSIAWVAAAVALVRAGMHRLRSSIPLLVGSLVVAAAIGLSRVELGVHWWTDVLGGWGLGLACFSVCALVAVVIVGVRQNAQAPA